MTRSANNKTREDIATISEIQWYSYFLNQFIEADAKKCEKFETELNDRLVNPGPGAFVVSTKNLSEVIRKLKKKKSMGCDGICALHFQNASYKQIFHLSLLYQMVFCSGVVPDSFF
jgi:predicted nucleic acid-binding protein